MTDTERQEGIKAVLASGMRLGFAYEGGAYWMTGFIVEADGAVKTVCRVKVEWLLDDGGWTHGADRQEVPPAP
jgi:hypothetical protein